jgi:hypothetical protein
MQTTTRINSVQIPQVNVTDQMNVQMNQARMNNVPAQLGQSLSMQHFQLMAANPTMRAYNAMVHGNTGFMRHPTAGVMNMQSSIQPPFIQSGQNIMMQSSFPIQNQLLQGQPSSIRPPMPRQVIRQVQGHPMLMRQPIIPQMMNQQLGVGQWVFQQNQNQLPQQPQNPPNWSGNGNTSGKQ